MKILRATIWLFAALPALATLLWVSLAGRFPEPYAQRRALGECSSEWDFRSVTVFEAEPANLLQRLANLTLLQLPGMSLAWTALLNAVFAVLLALGLSVLVRRAVHAVGLGSACVFFGAALLACSPAFGADWLYGERIGRFAVPLLFVAALVLMSSGGSFAWRALLTLVLVAAAPLFHDRGVIVFLALVPVFLVPGRLAWLIALLLVGNVAAISSFFPAGQLCLADEGLFGGVFASPGAATDELLRATGSLWPDLFADRARDGIALGALSWLLPLLWLWRVPSGEPAAAAAEQTGGESGGESGDESGDESHDESGDESGDESSPETSAAAAADAPVLDRVWWSCVVFGLLSVAWHYERHGFSFLVEHAMSPQARDELLYGGFLLPLGAIGLLASRLGAVVWPMAGSVVMAASLQGWDRGIETLRVARADVERVEATMLMPDVLAGPRESRDLPTRDIGELLLLEERGWVPSADIAWIPVIQAAVNADPTPAAGTFDGGRPQEQIGTAHSDLFGSQVSFVLIGVAGDGEPFRAVTCTTLEQATPQAAATPWRAVPVGTVPEGIRVRAVGIDVRSVLGFRLGPTYVVRDGVLVEEE